MANPYQHHYKNYYLDKFIKDAINSLTNEQLKLLDQFEHDRIRKKTIYRAPLEEKLWFLGKLGYRFALFIHPRKALHDVDKGLSFNNIAKALRIFKRKHEVANIKLLSGLGLFVQTDEQFMNSLALISTVYNSKLYTVVRDYNKIIENAEKISYSTISDGDAEEVKQAIKQTDNLILSAFDIARNSNSLFTKTFGITFNDYKILSFLSRKSNVVLKKELLMYLQVKLGGSSNFVGNLVKNKFIIQHSIDGKQGFTITGTGENVLRLARQYIIQNSI